MFTYVWPSLLKTISNVSLTDCIACFFPLCFHMKGKNISAPKIPWTDLGHRNLDEIFTGGKSQKTFIFQGLSEVVLLMAAFLSTQLPFVSHHFNKNKMVISASMSEKRAASENSVCNPSGYSLQLDLTRSHPRVRQKTAVASKMLLFESNDQASPVLSCSLWRRFMFLMRAAK